MITEHKSVADLFVSTIQRITTQVGKHNGPIAGAFAKMGAQLMANCIDSNEFIKCRIRELERNIKKLEEASGGSTPAGNSIEPTEAQRNLHAKLTALLDAWIVIRNIGREMGVAEETAEESEDAATTS